MEIIAKISRGTKMDQVYIPKARSGLEAGSYVIIKPLATEQINEKARLKPYFYGIKEIEPIKLDIINKTFDIIEKYADPQNIIITGSFLNSGFNFNDLDILIISKETNTKIIEKKLQSSIGIKPHILVLDKKNLEVGLSTDPLYLSMISKCVTKGRLIFNTKREINYKILDIHLLKSEPLIYSFDILNGEQKYYLIRNLISIKLFIENRNVDNLGIDREILKLFKIDKINIIKENMLNKKKFIEIYKEIYKQTQKNVFNFIKNDSK